MANDRVTKRGRRATHPKTKVCADCEKRKARSQFGNNSRMKHGKKSYCRACAARRQAEYRSMLEWSI